MLTGRMCRGVLFRRTSEPSGGCPVWLTGSLRGRLNGMASLWSGRRDAGTVPMLGQLPILYYNVDDNNERTLMNRGYKVEEKSKESFCKECENS